MDIYEDQRVFDRFIAKFPVKFEDSRDDFGRQVFLKDMSAQGACLVSREELPVHDNVSLQVKLPDGSTKLTLNGQIVWTKNKAPGAWEIGPGLSAMRQTHPDRGGG